MPVDEFQRLDIYLFKHHNFQSRNKAGEFIKDGGVRVNSKIVRKSSYKVSLLDTVELVNSEQFVSRAARKLLNFLKNNKISPKNKNALDIGSSTGGFVQILSKLDAKNITAIDVGREQLHQKIKDDPKVISYEGIDVRNFFPNRSYEFVTCDVSFVGLEYILDSINRLSSKEIVILFKPQFQVGKNVKRDKRGVVKDHEAIINSFKRFENMTKKLGWKLMTKEISTIKGKDGNQEFFYYFTK